jgi:hypothetical protein
MIITLPRATAVALTLTAAQVAAQEEQVPCTLTDGGQLDAAAQCEIIEDGDTVEYIGTLDENDVNFVAVINPAEGTGLLIGAGTFFLADGALDSAEAAQFTWPNGYVLTVEGEGQ